MAWGVAKQDEETNVPCPFSNPVTFLWAGRLHIVSVVATETLQYVYFKFFKAFYRLYINLHGLLR
jgi:hypothetical protein